MTCTFDDVLFLGLGKKVDNMRLSEISRLQRLMERNRNMKESRKLQEKLHQRFALPCACIIFGLVGTLTSLILPHDQKKTGFGLTLAIIFGYYMVSVFCSLVGQLGVISPSLGVWIPNLAGVGSVLVVSSWLDHHEP
ncbi:hypothetical protein O6H91_16G058100 [Diphasiastrum complanatum]|uniref:Uncharacterized protein n=1 Tax=Diphasiastrum complanatum TaxID=34168 RepID=A0ACC2BCS2_DIPCM|nr:hypothetical protein O6H91_16G058100 [Diphasiastrum complanatum]